jgi:hypothetical protein
MQSITRRDFLETSCLAAGALIVGSRSLSAAVVPGVETVVPPRITGEEISGQPDIWALEIRFKPVRMNYCELTDPASGKSAKQLVWYLAYRVVVREGSRMAEATAALRERPIFVPEFTFATDDDGKQKVYQDRILPEAQRAINRRERHQYKNTVEIVGPLPDATPEGAKVLKTLDGVATWTGIDPNTDYFAVYLTGFSNGYKTGKGPDGQEIILRRTLVQKFWRPSDRFDQTEDEIRLKDEPVWIYR